MNQEPVVNIMDRFPVRFGSVNHIQNQEPKH